MRRAAQILAAALAALGVVLIWAAGWVATAGDRPIYYTPELGEPSVRLEVPFSPPPGSLDWLLLVAPRYAVTALVVAALATRARRRASLACVAAATASVLPVLTHVAANEALALRGGVFAAMAAVAAAAAARPR